MPNLVTIKAMTAGGTDFVVPIPSTYVGNTATIVDSARNVEGKMIGTVVRNNVAKITMTWAYISAEDWANLLMQFSPAHGGNFTRNVAFFDQATNSVVTREMYVSDRSSSGSFLLHNSSTAHGDSSLIGLPRGYQGATFSLIEV